MTTDLFFRNVWLQVYGQLVAVCPDNERYKLYHAQALVKAGLFDDAQRICMQIDTSIPAPDASGTKLQPDAGQSSGQAVVAQRVPLLQATIKYEQVRIGVVSRN